MNKGTSKQTVIEIKGKDYSRKKKKNNISEKPIKM